VDQDVSPGNSYTYRVSAYDAAQPANESGQSAPVTVNLP
jgi:hypothetical protein